jgi:hypothetical protein
MLQNPVTTETNVTTNSDTKFGIIVGTPRLSLE